MLSYLNRPVATVLAVNIRTLARPGGGTLLEAIDFQLAEGECLAVIGPNGSGKSSLLQALCHALPAEGDIILYGRLVSSLTPRQRARIMAVMSQQDLPDLRLTLEDYVALGRIPFDGDMPATAQQAIVTAMLKETGLLSLRRRSLASLSGGERQRAALARVLTQTPRLLLLDEPTNHLDYPGREELLTRVKERGIAVVCVLHDLHLVETFADRLLMLANGRQVVCAPPARALQAEFLHPVFGLNSFTLDHPHQRGKRLRIFEVSP